MRNSTYDHDDWQDVTPAKARSIQESLRSRVVCIDEIDNVQQVAGVDVGFESNNSITRAAIAVLSYPDLDLLHYAIARRPTEFPYITGLLSFREIPAVLDAFEQLTQLSHRQPDLLLCDGQGIAHPRRFGLASHLGVITGIPSIGVAKSRLIGTHEPVAEEKGSRVLLYDKGEIIGAVLRSRDRVKPLYISIGHKLCLETAIEYVLQCLTRYRLPETTRWAHRLASGPALSIARIGDLV